MGAGHSKEYFIKDYESSVKTPAKIFGPMATIDLLPKKRGKAQEVISNHTPNMTKDSYFDYSAILRLRYTLTGLYSEKIFSQVFSLA
ncbi:MAG: hypothetical protein CM1200mP15_04750 [Dehalococcoidia bacterium]|nr:MAG: hypothetical protein CM1200mP15_04750 [Dehalococcoidia bacterium]